MDLGTAISKIRAHLEWMARGRPPFTGRLYIKVDFRKGKIVNLKKVARSAVL